MAARGLVTFGSGRRIRLSSRYDSYHSQVLPFLAPLTTCRRASGLSKTIAKGSKAREEPTKKKKERKEFRRDDIKKALQFSLCDAMQYIRAFEVGRQPTSSKYELAISLKTLKNGPVVRNRLRLSNAVDTSERICVICPPDSPAAKAAIKAGASLVGEDTIFDAVKEGRIEFERCICHSDSAERLNKANLGRVLGPKGLMPSTKTGTVVKDVAASVRNMIGGSEYREKIGVIRLAIGQLGFTPEQMQQNIKEFMEMLKRDLTLLNEKINKEVHEVVSQS
ncbi:mitochondrial 54S ribosomal protein mrpl1 [Lambiella insularis]|nr:mitochondrial 54S ribosomal protein mrpl1 [Lambiella insularis]